MKKGKTLLSLSALLAFTVGSAFAGSTNNAHQKPMDATKEKCEITIPMDATTGNSKIPTKKIIEVSVGTCAAVQAEVANGDLSKLPDAVKEELEAAK